MSNYGTFIHFDIYYFLGVLRTNYPRNMLCIATKDTTKRASINNDETKKKSNKQIQKIKHWNFILMEHV